MDNVVQDEIARINGTVSVLSDFEYDYHIQVVQWMIGQGSTIYGMGLADIAKLFWNERLN